MIHDKYTQHNFNTDLKDLLNQIEISGKKYDRVVAVMRGGLIPGVCVSHALNLPLESLQWSTRDFPDADIFNLTMRSDDRILLVDDICDSGKTLQTILDTFPKTFIHTAVLIHNTDLDFTPTYFSHKLSRKLTPNYIDFWWEEYK